MMATHSLWLLLLWNKKGSNIYYVIQKFHGDPRRHFISYKVPKFITSKTSDNVILEFNINGKIKRKWAPKKDIILLTEDPAFFKKKVEEFSAIEDKHIKKIEAVEKQLDEEVANFASTMNANFDSFEDEKREKDLPCVLSKFD